MEQLGAEKMRVTSATTRKIYFSNLGKFPASFRRNAGQMMKKCKSTFLHNVLPSSFHRLLNIARKSRCCKFFIKTHLQSSIVPVSRCNITMQKTLQLLRSTKGSQTLQVTVNKAVYQLQTCYSAKSTFFWK